MTVIRRFYVWVCEDDWRGLVVLLLAQAVFLLAFVGFALWISEYARLNWY
jgi:hypothetical protein